ncbi:hypothetical protein [Celeribacter neptunius]|uniref:Uncharacterized protein n=1 Tax=Celeribacter neptunius TaxID=588602 RepID=A0A1I3VIZ4_9RHOB|nr:hypothetical protein [Celeribacter neptunius]SFJ94286.1 hypothetical protein SAMN04487991_3357 [Celeribacter neptunius]
MLEFILSLIAAVLGELLVAWLLRLVLGNTAENLSIRKGNAQKIELSFWVMFFCLIVGAAFTILATYVWWSAGAPVALVGGELFVLVSVGSLWGIVNRQFVCWDEEGLWGNGTRRFGLLGRHVNFLRWDQLQEVGSTISGYDFVEAQDGRRVYWSKYYNGHRDWGETLYERCPYLFE